MTVCLFTLFDTPVGSCAIAWTERGVVGIQLPEGRERDTFLAFFNDFRTLAKRCRHPQFSALSMR